MSTIGPITKVTEVRDPKNPSTRLRVRRQETYRSVPRQQAKPLPYYGDDSKTLSADGSSFADCLNWGARSWVDYHGQPPMNRALQSAYGKLVGKVKELEQGWGENLATRKQSLDMILHRVGTLTTAARRLKKGDIPGFCRALGVTPRRTKSKLKKASSIWLEYHFGWEPLYGDIYTACKMLSDDPKLPAGTLKGVGVENVSVLLGQGYIPTRVTGRVIAVLQGDYYVENPNKFLLNEMGVINPLAVAWELVPFSFAVDWFIPVGQFLGSFTDFYGVHRENEFTTRYWDVKGTTWRAYSQPRDTSNTSCARVQRSLGISVPYPTLKLFQGFSLVRGATAVALLVGMLRSLG